MTHEKVGRWANWLVSSLQYVGQQGNSVHRHCQACAGERRGSLAATTAMWAAGEGSRVWPITGEKDGVLAVLEDFLKPAPILPLLWDSWRSHLCLFANGLVGRRRRRQKKSLTVFLRLSVRSSFLQLLKTSSPRKLSQTKRHGSKTQWITLPRILFTSSVAQGQTIPDNWVRTCHKGLHWTSNQLD